MTLPHRLPPAIIQDIVARGLAVPTSEPHDEHGLSTVQGEDGKVYRLTKRGLEYQRNAMKAYDEAGRPDVDVDATGQPYMDVNGERFYSAWESGPQGTVEFPVGKQVREAIERDKIYNVDDDVMQDLIAHGFAQLSPGDSGEGTVRSPEGDVYRLTEAGMDMLEAQLKREEDAQWRERIERLNAVVDAPERFQEAIRTDPSVALDFAVDATMTTDDAELDKRFAQMTKDLSTSALIGLSARMVESLQSAPSVVKFCTDNNIDIAELVESFYWVSQEQVDELGVPTLSAMKRHGWLDIAHDPLNAMLNDPSPKVREGLQRLKAGLDRLVGKDSEREREVLRHIIGSIRRTGHPPIYVSHPEGSDTAHVVSTLADVESYVKEHPPVSEWEDRGNGTWASRNDEGQEMIMDTGPGLSADMMQRALAGDMSEEELRAASPAAADVILPMARYNRASKLLLEATPDNPLWGDETADALLATEHLDPRFETDAVLLDMIREHDTELVGFNGQDRSGKTDQFRLTRQGARKAEDAVAREYNIPVIPEGQLRLLTIQTDGKTRMTCVDNDERNLLPMLQEFVGGSLEAVYCFDRRDTGGFPGVGQVRRLQGSGRADAIIYVNEEGILENLPSNYKATDLAYEIGAEWGDIGRGLVGNVAVLAVGPPDPQSEAEAEALGLGPWSRELPARVLDWVRRNEGVTAVAGVKECKTSVLRALSRNAAEERLDYVLDPRLDPLLDPNGVHIVRSLVTLDHQDAVPVEPFIRCELHAKVRNHPDPVVQTFIDMRLRDYVALHTPPGAEPIGGARGTGAVVRNADLTSDERTPREPRA